MDDGKHRAEEANRRYGGTQTRRRPLMDGFKVFVPHRANCYLREQKRNEFIVNGPTLYRAKDGSRRGSNCTWHTFRCNDADCPATVGVRWDVLMNFIAGGLRGRGL